MNLLLLEPSEIVDELVVLTGRREKHAREVLAAAEGDTLRVGVRGGNVGTAIVIATKPLTLQVTLSDPPPPRAGIDLLIAIPRPKSLKRIVQAAASLGVDRIMLIRAARVERSYFDSKVLAPEFLRELCDLGLEQARDTIAPAIETRDRFKPFVEDELAAWAGDARKVLLHPGPALRPTPAAKQLLAIGPDGGWVPFEVDLLHAHGFELASLGPRPLRTDVAVAAAIGALSP